MHSISLRKILPTLPQVKLLGVVEAGMGRGSEC